MIPSNKHSFTLTENRVSFDVDTRVQICYIILDRRPRFDPVNDCPPIQIHCTKTSIAC